MSNGAVPPEDRGLEVRGPDVLATASFPGADEPGLRDLVVQYARLLQACAKRTGEERPLDSEALLADPALACWLVQTIGGDPRNTARPAARLRTETASRAGSDFDVRRWPESLVEIAPRLCRPLTRDMGVWQRHPPALLRQRLATAMALLREAWPAAAAEVALLVRVLLDGVAAPGHQTSGSSAACPFVVAIKFDLDAWPGFIADALVHESSHIRLRLASRLTPMVDDDRTPRYRHPWRPDARPLEAVLVACHAFVAVHRFHARCGRLADGTRARAEAARLEGEVGQALAQLRTGWPDLTAAGRQIAERLCHEEERTRRGEWES